MKPWRKSVGFWLGAFVAVSLGWVMVDSVYWQSSLHRASASRIDALQTSRGSLTWLEIETPSGGHALGVGFGSFRTQLVDHDPDEPPGIVGHWAWNDVQPIDFARYTVRISVPLWFFLACWLACWIGGMVWWRRRGVALSSPEASSPRASTPVACLVARSEELRGKAFRGEAVRRDFRPKSAPPSPGPKRRKPLILQ